MKIAAGLDAGSSTTRCMIYGLDGATVRFLGCGEAECGGWFKARVADRDRLTESVLKAVELASRQAQVEIESVVVGVGGPAVKGFNHTWRYDFDRPREVDTRDLRYAIERASDVRLEHDRMILHVCPQDFTVDGRSRYYYPRGATCTRLEANVHLVTTSTQETHAVVSAIHQAHLAVDEIVFEPLAAAYAAVLQEDRKRGVALIDIGMHSTDLVIYDGDALVHSRSLPVSGDHLTRDVVWGLTVSYEDAELLKRQYGCAMLGLTADNSFIEVPSAEDREPRSAPCRRLNEILEARAEELFFYVQEELFVAGMDQALIEGVILTGGGALLPGMCDMAEMVLNCQARLGLTIGVRDLPAEYEGPLWTTAAGLAMYAARLRHRSEKRRKAPGLLGMVAR